jgi:cyanophycinase-like exopeptidase
MLQKTMLALQYEPRSAKGEDLIIGATKDAHVGLVKLLRELWKSAGTISTNYQIHPVAQYYAARLRLMALGVLRGDT